MIIHIVWLTAFVWTTSKCEPPVNSYLPPGGANGGERPSPIYGPATGNGNGSPGHNRPGGGPRTENKQPQDSYFPPGQEGFSNGPDTQYGLPGQNFNQGSQRPNSQDSSPSRGFSHGNNNVNAPNSQYGAPGQGNRSNQRQSNGNSSPQSSYESPNKDQGFGGTQHGRNGGQGQDSRINQRPDSSYGPPSTGTIQSSNGPRTSSQGFQDMLRSSYQSPNIAGSQGSFGGRQPASSIPSSSYGTPEFGSSSTGGRFGGGLESGNESDEPAKYEFSYDVDDAQTGTNFHHSEQRDGDIATGEYNVVLPDGRKQVVEYEAGLQGYKPQIRYEGRGGQERPGSGGSRRNQGYPQAQGGFGDSFQGQDNEIGYPRGNQAQDDRSSRFENSEDFGQSLSQLNAGQGHMGYPRGGPNAEKNGQASRRPNGRFDTANGEFGRPVGSGVETFNGDSQGYSSGRPNGGLTINNVGFSGSQSSNEGYPSGGPQGGSHGSQGGSRRDPQGGRSSSEGNANGYPSGRPSGPRGSGY